MPKDNDWMNNNGHLFCHVAPEDRASSCAIGLRSDIWERWKVEVVEAQRFHIHIRLRSKAGDEKYNVLKVYPPQRDRGSLAAHTWKRAWLWQRGWTSSRATST